MRIKKISQSLLTLSNTGLSHNGVCNGQEHLPLPLEFLGPVDKFAQIMIKTIKGHKCRSSVFNYNLEQVSYPSRQLHVQS